MLPQSPAIRRRVGFRNPEWLRAVVWLVAVALASGATAAFGADEAESALSTSPGIHVASFRLPSGTVYVNLPDDLAAGETFSVVVNPLPAGPDPSTPCDREDATEQGRLVRAGTGRPQFSALGFENDQLFEVRSADAERGRRLVLETEEEIFAIEADLAPER